MEAQQQQQQQYHYQYQPQPQPQPQTVETLTTQSYDSASQIQSYDHSTQSYYAAYQQQYPSNPYNQPQQQQPDYSSYYYPDYAASYQTDPNLVHPPGVPISVDSQQTHVQDPHNLYYQHGVVASHHPLPPQPQGYLMAGGSQAGQPLRGRGTFGRHGRGRGGGRGKHGTQISRSSATAATGGAQSVTEGQAAPTKHMAWCEICRTDCTTLEVLEQHKNGKRHKRNLKVHEELQNLSRHLTMQEPTPEVIPPQKPEGSYSNPTASVNVAIMPAAPDNSVNATAENEKPETSGALPSQESVRHDHFGGRGGLKRKIRGGRGGKWLRAFDGARKVVQPPKPKQAVPLICNLCNVKCESQVVFESHIAGKKHIANVKRFEGHKEALGDGIQALYPTIANLPATVIVPQANQQVLQVPHDTQALASMMLSQQNLQDPQAAHAALTQLLQQHGIHDAQTLITQLVPYLLAQTPQVPGVLPVPAAGSGIDTQQNSLSQGAHITAGAESHNVAVVNLAGQQVVTSNVDSQAVVGTNDKPADAPPAIEGQS